MLPAEILEVIFSFLGDCDLVNVQQVSKQFRRIVVYYYWWPKLKKIIGVWTFLKSLLNHKLLYNMFMPIFCIYRWRLPSRIESKAELDWNPRGSFGSRPIFPPQEKLCPRMAECWAPVPWTCLGHRGGFALPLAEPGHCPLQEWLDVMNIPKANIIVWPCITTLDYLQ